MTTKTKLLIDTSAYSAFNRADMRLKDYFQSQNELLMPLIVVAELRAGFALGTRVQENEALLQRLLDSPSVETVTISDKTTRLFAEIFRRLRLQGTPININDIWIAALALEHNCMLVTLDSDFQHVPDLLSAAL